MSKSGLPRLALLGLAVLAVIAVAIPAAGAARGAKPAATPEAKVLRTLKDRSASKAFWRAIPRRQALSRRGRAASIRPAKFRSFTLDRARLHVVLAKAPRERTAAARRQPLVISLPAPGGSFQRFAVEASPIMEPALARKHPEIKTYAGTGVDDPAATIRLDVSPLGFHASVRSPKGVWYIDPAFRGDGSRHLSYFARELKNPRGTFVERDGDAEQLAEAVLEQTKGPSVGSVLRTYRLALLSDPSYSLDSGGPALVTAAKVALMNRVNQIYEDETSIRLILIGENDLLNLNTPALATEQYGPCGAAACFTAVQLASGCTGGLLNRNRIVIGQIVGASRFDVGHIILGEDGGGVAGLAVVGGDGKARGCTGLPNPFGDFFAVDYVAHELGHQFAGNHSFNGNQLNCSGGNRNGGTSVEPGSGSSVMAYAGICRQDNLQPHSDPYWSQRSFEEIANFVASTRPPINEVQNAALRDFSGGDEVQVASLTGFSPTQDAFQVQIGGANSALIGLGGLAVTDANLTTAINAIPGFAGTVAVTGAGNAGFTATFGGASAASDVENLSIVNCAPSCSGLTTETFKGGATNDSFTLNYNGTDTVPIVRGSNYTAAGIQAALQGVNEAQQVALTGYDTDGDSYTLNYNGADTVPITRGQNNTAAGIQAAIQGGNEQQQVLFTGFNAANSSFQVQIGGASSAVIGSGGLAYTAANIAAAVNAIPGFAGTATSNNPTGNGFTLTFSGASANTDIPSIAIVNLTCTAACSSVVRETVKGTTGVAGWIAGSTVSILALTDAGYSVVFNGLGDVGELAVTNASGVTGAVTTTTQGTSGILPVGATGVVAGFGGGTFDGTGFQVSFGGVLAAQNLDSLSLTNLVGSTGFVGEIAKGGAVDNQGNTVTPTGNTAPVVDAPASYTIPYRTPFALTGSATDVNGDTLTYLWEQNDIGAAAIALVNPAKVTGPLFRQFGTAMDDTIYDETIYNSPGLNAVTTNPTRVFPDLAQILANNTNAVTGDCPGAPAPPPPPSGPSNVPLPMIDCYSEFLPTAGYAGPMHFRLTARDGNPGAGGIGSEDTEIVLAPGTGPFLVTSHGSAGTVDGGSSQTVTWDVAGTNAAPIGAAEVQITLSTDGGLTHTHVLAAATANDGSEAVTLPNVATTGARIKVEAVGNVFFDVSDADLTISALPVVGNDAPAGGAVVQYSDALSPTVTISATDADTAGSALTASASGLPTGLTLAVGTTSANGRTWTVAGNVTAAPGTYPVTVTVTDDAGHAVTTAFTIRVTPEDAAATYTGDTLAFSAPGRSSATILLRATVVDSADGAPGDIRNASVAFKRGAATLCGPVSVARLGTDPAVGTASCTASVPRGSNVVDVVVGSYYTGSASRTVVVRRAEDAKVKADGRIVATDSAGTHAADDGSRVEFELDGRFRDSGHNYLDGDVAIEFRAGGRRYELESSGLDSLGVSGNVAELRSTASLSDTTGKRAVRVASGLTLQIVAVDGRRDWIAITAWNGNTLAFSSRWSGTKTLLQRLDSGRVDVDD